MMHLLQSIIFPALDSKGPDGLYFRSTAESGFVRFGRGYEIIKKGTAIAFDTYFNGVSIGKWKSTCDIDDLYFALKGSGRFILRFGLHKMGQADRWLYDQEINLPADIPCTVPLSFWHSLDDGQLYVWLLALEDNCFIEGGEFLTHTEPKREVRLGIVITHFNRKQWVLPAIERITTQLLNDPRYISKISLIVVDNSQNISFSEALGATVIPNPNYGGAGGFTRGLMYLEDLGTFTHCMFMDDDASCEIESLRRTYAILHFTKLERIAVSGAQIREDNPYEVHEITADFHGDYRAIYHGSDLRDISTLLQIEVPDPAANYGGWWLFAFPISAVRYYPFPFFVRCDDVLFGIMNDFDLVSMNGIACWAEDFFYKESPMVRYLSIRNTIVATLLGTNRDGKCTAQLMKKWTLDQLYTYLYGSTKAATEAIVDLCKGPKFFQDNLDMSSVRANIKAYADEEKMGRIPRPLYIRYLRWQGESWIRERIRTISLNGFLLPNVYLIKETLHQDKHFNGNPAKTFRFSSIFYEHIPTGTAMLAHYNRREFFAAKKSFEKALAHFEKNFDQIKKSYREALPYYTSRKFWEKVYGAHKVSEINLRK